MGTVKPLFPTSRWESREVSKDCFISYLGNKYSVPFRFASQRVKIRVTLEQELEIYDELECIAQHPLISEKAKMSMKAEHFEGIHSAKKRAEAKES
ncbi:Mu transposase domain-containing protein [Bacillus vallismortis]|uniref:Mu transposase domain-containing protein n=1 Tax=Bacillus vallismortis TaxID=72361 RepID=UPI003B97E674